MTAPLLQLTSVTKSFGAVRALKGVSFDLRAGDPGQARRAARNEPGVERSDTPGGRPQNVPHPGGVPESSGVSHADLLERISGTPPGCIPIVLVIRGCRLALLGSTPG